MRTIFMGTPDFSVPVLSALAESEHMVAAVVTQPDRPKGRGKGVAMSPVKEKALEYEIPVLQPRKVRDPAFVEELKSYEPDVCVVVAFGQILSREVLAVPRYGCINVHASLLPRYRGASPIQQVILDGEKETGVTTMMMDEGLDTGDILLQKSIAIAPDETGGSLFDKLSELGAPLLLETLRRLEAGTLTRIPQTGETCYAGMIQKSMGEIRWSLPALELERLVRGMDPWPSAYTRLHGKTLKIWQAQADPAPVEGVPGTIAWVKRDSLGVVTGEGTLILHQLQLEGKKRMSADAFLRGYPVQPGTRLGE